MFLRPAHRNPREKQAQVALGPAAPDRPHLTAPLRPCFTDPPPTATPNRPTPPAPTPATAKTPTPRKALRYQFGGAKTPGKNWQIPPAAPATTQNPARITAPHRLTDPPPTAEKISCFTDPPPTAEKFLRPAKRYAINLGEPKHLEKIGKTPPPPDRLPPQPPRVREA